MKPWSFSSLNHSIFPRCACTGRLAQSVDNAPPGQVVRRKLDPDAVAEHDPDSVALHPPGHVAERLVPVVELDAVHPVAERLDDLALHLDLLFLARDDVSHKYLRFPLRD